MMSGSSDNRLVVEKYPNVARFMEKPKSEDLPANFNTFYGPRILEQLPHIIKELTEHPDTRRAVISILDSKDLLLLDKHEQFQHFFLNQNHSLLVLLPLFLFLYLSPPLCRFV
jgi:hypothetical protein